MRKCIIIEDQLPAQRILKRYLEDYGELELLGAFTSPIEALKFMETTGVDVLFLDIHLPKLSGMEFLRSMKQTPAVILTTAFTDYAAESYEYDVTDYLVKPFSFDRFLKAVAKLDPQESKLPVVMELVVKSGHEFIRLRSTEVMYIHSDMDYTELHVGTQKHLSSETLAHWEGTLTKAGFVRIHRSYVVNLSYVSKVLATQCTLTTGETLPVGRRFKEQLFKRISS